MLKEKDKTSLPLNGKLTTASLRDVVWTPIEENVWRAEARQSVSINLHKLLRLAEHKRLALQVCCLRGHSVQYKFAASFLLLLDLTDDEQCFLHVHYPGVYRHLTDPAEPPAEHHGQQL